METTSLPTATQQENLPVRAQAIQLHEEIVAHGTIAAEHLYLFCQDLKRMKESELYTELGYTSFENYSQEALGLGQRQAYYYISVYDNLEESYVVEHAQLGISKLVLLASASGDERKKLEESIPIEKATTKEMKEALDKIKNMQQQLKMFEEENRELKERIEDGSFETSEDAMRRLEEQEAQIAAAKREAAVAAAEAARAEIKAELDKLAKEKERAEIERKEAEKRAKEAEKKIADAEKEKKAVAAEKDKLAKELEIEKKQVKVDPEIQAALEEEKAKREQLEKQLKVSADPEMTRFAFLLENFKGQGERVLAYMAETAKKHHVDDDANICKMREATAKLLDAIKAKV